MTPAPPDAERPREVATWSDLPDREPTQARVAAVDLVIVRDDETVSVLYGRCLHRGVLLADGYIEGDNLICGVHGRDYRYDTGVSEYDNSEVLETFTAWVEEDADAVSPAQFEALQAPAEFAELADRVRAAGGGIPVGFKLSAQHIEADIDFALEAGADYLILDGRGGGTGAAPDVFKDNISVPTMAAIPRARRHLDERGRSDVTLIATGGLRTESDFIKAMALGADGVAVANAAMQAIGCLGMRACDSNNCPVGITSQREDLRDRIVIDSAANGLQNFFEATVKLMKVMARACGHDSLSGFTRSDLTTWKRDVADLTGVEYAGVGRGEERRR